MKKFVVLLALALALLTVSWQRITVPESDRYVNGTTVHPWIGTVTEEGHKYIVAFVNHDPSYVTVLHSAACTCGK